MIEHITHSQVYVLDQDEAHGLWPAFGNHIRIGQPKEGPIEVPDPGELATENA